MNKIVGKLDRGLCKNILRLLVVQLHAKFRKIHLALFMDARSQENCEKGEVFYAFCGIKERRRRMLVRPKNSFTRNI